MQKFQNVGITNGCYGCTVCVLSCSKNAIQISIDEDGFYHPIINENKCVNCGLCLKTCSFLNRNERTSVTSSSMNGYATYSKSEIIRNTATSGGTTYEILKHLVSNGYTAIVVKYNVMKNCPEYYMTTDIDELWPSMGSKYLQSTIEELSNLIDYSKKNVVVGTPCSIESFRRLSKIKKAENNFIFIDFFCHGVPSRLMWKKYLDEASKAIGLITNVKFRSKKYGWQKSTTTHLIGEKGYIYSSAEKGDLFFKFFLGDYCLQKACYDHCKFKLFNSSADIRVGDMWGKTFTQEEKGITGVLTFSSIGEIILKETDSVEIQSFAPEQVAEGQLRENVKRPLAYPIVRKLLKTSLSLKTISNIISPISFMESLPGRIRYYSRRLPKKIHAWKSQR